MLVNSTQFLIRNVVQTLTDLLSSFASADHTEYCAVQNQPKMASREGRESSTGNQEGDSGDKSDEDVVEHENQGAQENGGEMINVEFDFVPEISGMISYDQDHESDFEVHTDEVNRGQEDDHTVVTGSSFAAENPVAIVHESQIIMRVGLPTQESDGDQGMVAGSVLGGENSVVVHEFGTQMHGGLPLQESSDGDQGMVAGSVLAGENSVMVHEFGTQTHGGLPLQESGDGNNGLLYN